MIIVFELANGSLEYPSGTDSYLNKTSTDSATVVSTTHYERIPTIWGNYLLMIFVIFAMYLLFLIITAEREEINE
jgi:hypothetical protein